MRFNKPVALGWLLGFFASFFFTSPQHIILDLLILNFWILGAIGMGVIWSE